MFLVAQEDTGIVDIILRNLFNSGNRLRNGLLLFENLTISWELLVGIFLNSSKAIIW